MQIPAFEEAAMKYIFCLTLQCNLRCTYCYIDKAARRMSMDTAAKIVDFIYQRTPPGAPIDIGFFGGEPLLEFELMRAITDRIEAHPDHDPSRVELSVVTNGTIYNDEIADFIAAHRVGFGISCDGPPDVHDRSRVYASGKGSGALVERNIRRALERFPNLMVNAVYRPDTVARLPEVVRWLAGLGVTQIYLNADFSAPWTAESAACLPAVYGEIADLYQRRYEAGAPLHINLLDSKIAVILRGGYHADERCSMGRGELAFAPNGNIFPCERLIGAGDDNEHCIGHIDTGVRPERMACHEAPLVNPRCLTCGLRDHCARWCGCTNYFSTGYYNRVGALLCASERAVIEAAYRTLHAIEDELGPTFVDHLAGRPGLNSVARRPPSGARAEPERSQRGG